MPTTLVLLAVAYAAVAHGAFHAGELAVVVAIVAVALGLALVSTPPERADLGAPALAAGALAAWYLVAAAIAGNVTGAGPAVGLLFAAAAIIAILRRADDDERDLVLVGVLAIGALVALSGWIGVAFHHGPWAIPDNGLWRAASTITYANATGGLLAALTLVALDRAVVLDGRAARLSSLFAMACGLGLLATASRGALAGFALGLVVLGGLRRRCPLGRVSAPLLGALIGFGALLPSMPGDHSAHPAFAIGGAVVGAAIALAPTRIAIATALVSVLVGVAVPAVRADARAAWKPIAHQRLTADSPDRSHERRAALDVVRDHPLVGVGPGNVDLQWSVFYFVPVTFSVHYAHDEYLQLLVESGVVGLLIAMVGVAAVLNELLRRARFTPQHLAAAGIAAALVALAVQSATDFLWHVPLLPVTVSAIIGVLTPARRVQEPV